MEPSNILAAVTGFLFNMSNVSDKSRSSMHFWASCFIILCRSSVHHKSADENEQNHLGIPSCLTITNKSFCTDCQQAGVPRIDFRNSYPSSKFKMLPSESLFVNISEVGNIFLFWFQLIISQDCCLLLVRQIKCHQSADPKLLVQYQLVANVTMNMSCCCLSCNDSSVDSSSNCTLALWILSLHTF